MDTKAIKKVLREQIRPVIQNHGGDVFFVDIEKDVLIIKLAGACSGCPSADLVTRAWIEDTLREIFPEIRRVELDDDVDEELLAFAKKVSWMARRE